MKEFKEILLFIGAVIVTFFLVPLGIAWNVIKSIYEAVKMNPVKAVVHFFTYWLKLGYQIWVVVKYLLYHLAMSLDFIWNATSGELVEDFVTDKENTLYGDGGVTISASTGKLELDNKLNKTGLGFTRFLDKVFKEKKHCVVAYNNHTKSIR